MKKEYFIEEIYQPEVVGFEAVKSCRLYKMKNAKKTVSDDLDDETYFKKHVDLLSKNTIAASAYPTVGFLWRDDFLTKASVSADYPYAFELGNFNLLKDGVEKTEAAMICDKEIEIMNYERIILRKCINSIMHDKKQAKNIAPQVVDGNWRKILNKYLKEKPF